MPSKETSKIQYSFVPNHRDIMEALAKSKLSAREFRAVILILNQTNGYLREDDKIKPGFFLERAAIDKENLRHVTARLRSWNVITKVGHTYRVNSPKVWSPDVFIKRVKNDTVSRRNRVNNDMLSGENRVEIDTEKDKEEDPNRVEIDTPTVSNLTRSPVKIDTDLATSKENLLKKNLLKKTSSPRKSSAGVKPYQVESGGFLDWVANLERVRFPNRAKLMGLIRGTLVATEATVEDLKKWYLWVKDNDTYWGAREPPVIIGKAPEKFPTWLRDRKEGGSHGRGSKGGAGGKRVERRRSITYIGDPEPGSGAGEKGLS